MPKRFVFCVLAHPCLCFLYVLFHYSPFALSSLLPLPPSSLESSLEMVFAWRRWMTILYVSKTLLLKYMTPLKAAFFTHVCPSGPLSVAASNVGVEGSLECPLQVFPRGKLTLDSSTQARSQISTVSEVTWESLYLLTAYREWKSLVLSRNHSLVPSGWRRSELPGSMRI